MYISNFVKIFLVFLFTLHQFLQKSILLVQLYINVIYF